MANFNKPKAVMLRDWDNPDDVKALAFLADRYGTKTHTSTIMAGVRIAHKALLLADERLEKINRLENDLKRHRLAVEVWEDFCDRMKSLADKPELD